jgi:hypothetical protein
MFLRHKTHSSLHPIYAALKLKAHSKNVQCVDSPQQSLLLYEQSHEEAFAYTHERSPSDIYQSARQQYASLTNHLRVHPSCPNSRIVFLKRSSTSSFQGISIILTILPLSSTSLLLHLNIPKLLHRSRFSRFCLCLWEQTVGQGTTLYSPNMHFSQFYQISELHQEE